MAFSWLPRSLLRSFNGPQASNAAAGSSRGGGASYEPVLGLDSDDEDDLNGSHRFAVLDDGSPSKRSRHAPHHHGPLQGGASSVRRAKRKRVAHPWQWRSGWTPIVLIASAGVILVVIISASIARGSTTPVIKIDETTGLLTWSSEGERVKPPAKHPILRLIQDANEKYERMGRRRREETSLRASVDDYKRTWRMSPPEGFERW